MNIKTPLIKWGWVRAVLYFVLIAGGIFATQMLTHPFEDMINLWGYGELSNFVLFVIVYSISTLFVFLFTWLYLKFIDRLHFQDLGFGLKDNVNEAGIGFFVAVFLLGLGSLILIATGHLNILSAKFDFQTFGLQLVLMIFFVCHQQYAKWHPW